MRSKFAKDFILGVLPLVLGIELLASLIFIPIALKGNCDFRGLYAAGYMLRSGHSTELHDPAKAIFFQSLTVSPRSGAIAHSHLAYEIALLAPLSFLSFRAAYLAFNVLNLLALGGCFFVLRRLFPGRDWEIAAVLPGFAPIAAALLQGQDSIFLLLIFSATALFLKRDKDWIAGLVLGVGMFKFQHIVPIAALFLLWRRWRFVAGAAITAVASLAVSTVIVGVDQMVQYAHATFSLGTAATSADRARFALDANGMANLRGLLDFAGLLAIVSASLLVFAIAAISGARRSEIQFPLAILTSALVSYHLLAYDLAILVIPILWAVNHTRKTAVIAAIFFFASVIVLIGPQYVYLLSLAVLAFFVMFLWESAPLSMTAFRSGTPTPACE